MIDTHTHLYYSEDYPDGGSREAVKRALEEGVSHMVFPGVDASTIPSMLELHSEFPENTSLAFGLHPSEVDGKWKDQVNRISDLISGHKIVGIGEIGMDLYHEKSFRSEQMDAFGEQLQLASEMGVPVIIHCREAFAEAMEIIRSMGHEMPMGVFHSFTAGRRELDMVLKDMPEAWFGINGVATFKNAATLREAIKEIPLEKLVLETDAPWLAPEPFRGRVNESSYLPKILQRLADLRGMSPEEMEQLTDSNAHRLFPLI